MVVRWVPSLRVSSLQEDVTHVHLRGASAQQVDQSRVEGHDGVPHVHHLLFVLAVRRPVQTYKRSLRANQGTPQGAFKPKLEAGRESRQSQCKDVNRGEIFHPKTCGAKFFAGRPTFSRDDIFDIFREFRSMLSGDILPALTLRFNDNMEEKVTDAVCGLPELYII